MSVFKINKTSNYTVMSNYHLRDKTLSLRGKGLLSVMLSLPPDWDYSIAGLASILKENVTAVKTTLEELKTTGYLNVTKLYANQTKSGHIEYVYDVYEEPRLKGSKLTLENQCLETQPIESLMQINKDKQSKDNEIKNKEVVEVDKDLDANASQKPNSNSNNRKQFYYINDLDIPTLKELKQVVLENRFEDEATLTYRDIQKQFHLVDNIEFDTPLYIDSLITLKQQAEIQSSDQTRYY